MIELPRLSILLLALPFFLYACDQMVADSDDVVLAEVGNRVLYLSELKKDISPEQFAEDSVAVIERYRNSWINRQLKVKEAQRLGLHQNEEVNRRIRKAEEAILADAFNEAVYLEISGNPISRADAQSYYESNKDKFILAERHVRFRHMMASSLSDAQNARIALQRGNDWRSVVERFSVNPQQAIRNAQQYWSISSAVREYEPLNNFLHVIGVTEISPIRRINDHYHFVQLLESRDAGEHPKMEWVIDQITEWLMLENKRKHLQSMEQNLFLRAQANNELRIFDVRIPEQEVEIITDSL